MANWKRKYPGRLAKLNAAWAARNPDKVKEYAKRWREKHPEKVAEKSAIWRKKHKYPNAPRNRDVARRNYEAWLARNHDKIVARREFEKQARAIASAEKKAREEPTRALLQAERALIRTIKKRSYGHVCRNNRRARKLLNGGTVRKADVDALYSLQKGRCAHAWCRVSLTRKRHIDHVIPLFLGGRNDKRNIQLLCATCNMSKGAKHPIDFAQQNGFLL